MGVGSFGGNAEEAGSLHVAGGVESSHVAVPGRRDAPVRALKQQRGTRSSRKDATAAVKQTAKWRKGCDKESQSPVQVERHAAPLVTVMSLV